MKAERMKQHKRSSLLFGSINRRPISAQINTPGQTVSSGVRCVDMEMQLVRSQPTKNISQLTARDLYLKKTWCFLYTQRKLFHDF